MKSFRIILNIITLLSSALLLFTLFCVFSDLYKELFDNEIINKIFLYNTVANPILSIITTTSNMNKESE